MLREALVLYNNSNNNLESKVRIIRDMFMHLYTRVYI